MFLWGCLSEQSSEHLWPLSLLAAEMPKRWIGRRMMNEDAWEMFSKLCKEVCENENVFLDVIISPGMIEMMLMPLEGDYEDDRDDY